jgi:hypothetical protein
MAINMDRKQNEQLTLPGGGRYSFSDIAAEKESKLEDMVRRGVMPELTSIAGWEFRGRNISVISNLLGIRKFIKGFCHIPAETENPGEIDGYNLWVLGAGTKADSWPPLMWNGKPWRHGFFKVYPVKPDQRDNKYPNALLIDYSRGDNPVIHPSKNMRDYLVQVYEDNPDLLMGKVYVPLGAQRIFSGYFVMERMSH